MITANTGLPGSGKTLQAVEFGVSEVLSGRRVYALDINGLDYEATGILAFPGEFAQWMSVLKAGDLLIADEVQRYLGKDVSRRGLPSWVEELTRNRHYGIDMLWTTQDPMNLDPFVRRLINVHVHFVNKFGGPSSRIFKWQNGVHDVDSTAEKKKAEVRDYKYPASVFGLYKSAELHTRKKETPRKFKTMVFGFAVAIALLVGGVYFAAESFGGLAKSSGAAVPGGKAEASGGGGLASAFLPSGEKKKTPLTKAEYYAQLQPRMPGFMWSAPIFDNEKPQARPETYCMAVSTGECKCLSDQGTRIDMAVAQCRLVALNGVYNPFRRPLEDRQTRGVDWKPQVTARDTQAAGRETQQSLFARTQESPGSGPAVSDVLHVQGPPRSAAGRGRISAPYNADAFGPQTSQF